MKVKTIFQILLAVVIVGLAYLLYDSIMTPMRFDNEYIKRRDACAVKLKAIRTLEEAHKTTYGSYTGSFDTLFHRMLEEDSMRIVSKVVNLNLVPADVDIYELPEKEAIKNGYITLKEVYVNPVANLRENGKLPIVDNNGYTRQMTDDEILNLRYVPYPKGTTMQFELAAGMVEKSGFMVPVFECKVPLDSLLSDLDRQTVVNKKAEIHQVKDRYAGWKVGDLNNAITDGNFE